VDAQTIHAHRYKGVSKLPDNVGDQWPDRQTVVAAAQCTKSIPTQSPGSSCDLHLVTDKVK